MYTPSALALAMPLKLTFTTQVRLKLSKHPLRVEEALAGRGADINRLFGRLERG